MSYSHRSTLIPLDAQIAVRDSISAAKENVSRLPAVEDEANFIAACAIRGYHLWLETSGLIIISRAQLENSQPAPSPKLKDT